MGFAGSVRFRMVAIAFALALPTLALPSLALIAQDMRHDQMPSRPLPPLASPASSTGVLTVASVDKTVTVLPEAFRILPHKTITVRNGHTNTEETYSGVLLSDLLVQVSAPLGPKLHGKVLASYVLAGGNDGYQAVYSIAEVDPTFHSGDVIVADSLNGKPLTGEGPFKLVNTEDKHPARWVRNLVSIKLVTP